MPLFTNAAPVNIKRNPMERRLRLSASLPSLPDANSPSPGNNDDLGPEVGAGISGETSVALALKAPGITVPIPKPINPPTMASPKALCE